MDLLVFAAVLLALSVLVGGHLVFATVTAVHVTPGGSPWWAGLEDVPNNHGKKK